MLILLHDDKLFNFAALFKHWSVHWTACHQWGRPCDHCYVLYASI